MSLSRCNSLCFFIVSAHSASSSFQLLNLWFGNPLGENVFYDYESLSHFFRQYVKCDVGEPMNENPGATERLNAMIPPRKNKRLYDER